MLLCLLVLFSISVLATGCSSFPFSTTGTPASTPTFISPEPGILTPSSTIPAPLQTETPQVSSLDIQAEDLRGEMVRFWHPFPGASGQVMEDLVEQFNLTNPWGILVTSIALPGYDALHSALMVPSQKVDAPHAAAGFLHQALTWEKILPLADLQIYVEDPEWGLSSQEKEDFYPLFWEGDVVDGRRLGVPVYRSTHLLFYNQTWAKELGYQLAPASAAQFRQQTCAAAQSYLHDDAVENNGTGGWIVSTDPAVTLGWFQAFSGEVLKTPEPSFNQTVYQFNTPSIQDTFIYMRSLYDDGCAWLSQAQVPDLAFASRQGLLAAGSVMDIPHQVESFRSAGSRDQWTVLPFPSPEQTPALDVYGPSYFIFESSAEEQLAAWLFIRWLSSPENSARLVESSGAFPVRSSSTKYLEAYGKRYPQWAAALDLLKYAHGEPAFASWGSVRRSLGDAATQLYRSYFTAEQIPSLLTYLDNFSSELHLGPDLDSVFATTTPTPGARPSRTPAPAITPTKEIPPPVNGAAP
jgi:multiple sugar transport system substrate-binding protein/sn-glycerol 3-phosphate transport system substrate-binding protein